MKKIAVLMATAMLLASFSMTALAARSPEHDDDGGGSTGSGSNGSSSVTTPVTPGGSITITNPDGTKAETKIPEGTVGIIKNEKGEAIGVADKESVKLDGLAQINEAAKAPNAPAAVKETQQKLATAQQKLTSTPDLSTLSPNLAATITNINNVLGKNYSAANMAVADLVDVKISATIAAQLQASKGSAEIVFQTAIPGGVPVFAMQEVSPGVWVTVSSINYGQGVVSLKLSGSGPVVFMIAK